METQLRSEVPSLGKGAFNCPHCGVLTSQTWHHLYGNATHHDNITSYDQDPYIGMYQTFEGNVLHEVVSSSCYNCRGLAVWVQGKLVYPAKKTQIEPNPDLPPDVRRDFLEAAAILDHSPRGAAALLRLAIQKLCVELGGSGKNINEDIKSLVQKGLDPRVQMALDVVRVIGNNAVHPGEIDTDNRDHAVTLLNMVNLIAEKMLTVPKQIEETYAGLPPSVLEAIKKRDGK